MSGAGQLVADAVAAVVDTTGDAAVKHEFLGVMAGVCAPVSIITAMDGDRPHGTTVSAFASLSMDPPMVLVSLDRASQLLGIIRRTGRFGVNVLSSDQSLLARRFASKGSDKFADVVWDLVAEAPRIPGSKGWLSCAVDAAVDGGDHVVLMGRVVDAGSSALSPLTYHARTFGTHAALDADQGGSPAAAPAAVAEQG